MSMLPSSKRPVSCLKNKYAIPVKPTNIAKYLVFEISSSFKSSFIQITVNTGAELMRRVTRPEEIY